MFTDNPSVLPGCVECTTFFFAFLYPTIRWTYSSIRIRLNKLEINKCINLLNVRCIEQFFFLLEQFYLMFFNKYFVPILSLLSFQIELERLNTATDDINKLEVDLDVSIINLVMLLYTLYLLQTNNVSSGPIELKSLCSLKNQISSKF